MTGAEPHDFRALGALRDGKPTSLKTVYAEIEVLRGGGHISPGLSRLAADGEIGRTTRMSFGAR
jgi:hypothetical protein